MRLDRLLSRSGYGSRSEVRKMVRDGRVRVDGAVAKDSGMHLPDDRHP
ncbi:MAG TPA: S4 domain-containing protein, partial [Clostridia bacterium]